MKTKEKIKQVALALFNTKGFKNVTLREIAKTLAISYGNVTYHFENKHRLILSLYEDMLTETEAIFSTLNEKDLLTSLLQAPKHSFDISIKFLFFYVDFVEIKRTYTDISSRLEQDNTARKTAYLSLLQTLQADEFLRLDLTDQDLDYLMELSGAMRTFFFINLNPEQFSDPALKTKYVQYVNRLIFPYLTAKGMVTYKAF